MRKKYFSGKKIILCAVAVLSFILFLILSAMIKHLAGSQESQQMAARWSDKKNVAQISCFFSPNAYVTEDSIEEFEHTLDRVLEEASIVSESENPGARLWADAYSASGEIMISSDRTMLMADAIGIGGDFFLFHPLKLLNGSYFSGNDLMQDYCIIDEDAAWQLFGSNDVAGLMVTINQIPHMVVGVVERPKGRLEEAAGLQDTLVYVSYETLQKVSPGSNINHYEIVMPNPVSDFARQKVQENFFVSEKEVEIIENTSRYSLVSGLKLFLEFGTRSMNGKAIIYPYWENVARGYEDIIALLTILMLLFLAFPIMYVLVCFVKWWRHKGWTIKDGWHFCKDKTERFFEKKRVKKLRKKREKKGINEGDWLEWL